MEYSFYDFLKLLGSLALFLYGMKIMSEGLQKFAGDRLRKILTAMTTNRVTGVDRKSTRLNSSHTLASRMPSSA